MILMTTIAHKNILLRNFDNKYLLYNNKRLDIETFYNSEFKSKFFNFFICN